MAESRGARPVGVKKVRWTRKMVEDFLDHLAVTCDVRASARVIGVYFTSVYNKRRNDPEFRAQWEDALVCGYQMLETRLVGHALAGGKDDDGLPGDDSVPPISVDFAMRLLGMRRSADAGRGAPRGPRRTRATKVETIAAILKKLAAIEARAKAKS